MWDGQNVPFRGPKMYPIRNRTAHSAVYAISHHVGIPGSLATGELAQTTVSGYSTLRFFMHDGGFPGLPCEAWRGTPHFDSLPLRGTWLVKPLSQEPAQFDPGEDL